jgi:hypothetical protein
VFFPDRTHVKSRNISNERQRQTRKTNPMKKHLCRLRHAALPDQSLSAYEVKWERKILTNAFFTYIPVIAYTDGRHGMLQYRWEMQITGPERCLTSPTAHTWVRSTYRTFSVMNPHHGRISASTAHPIQLINVINCNQTWRIKRGINCSIKLLLGSWVLECQLQPFCYTLSTPTQSTGVIF